MLALIQPYRCRFCGRSAAVCYLLLDDGAGLHSAGPRTGEEEQGHLPSMLMQSLLASRSAVCCKGSASLAKAVTSQLLTLCRGRDVSAKPLSCSGRPSSCNVDINRIIPASELAVRLCDPWLL